jgi:hypothetical protein
MPFAVDSFIRHWSMHRGEPLPFLEPQRCKKHRLCVRKSKRFLLAPICHNPHKNLPIVRSRGIAGR